VHGGRPPRKSPNCLTFAPIYSIFAAHSDVKLLPKANRRSTAMLSIALIAAALLVAWIVLQLRGTAQEPTVSNIKTVSGISPAGGVQHQSSTTAHGHGPEIVALTLRVANVACACEKAQKFADKTFLVADAPKLPFNDCGRVDCRCRYERVGNRRKGERRASDHDRRDAIRFEMKDDRRKGKDRRKTNNLWRSPV
jgi:hypothetical protein